MISTIRKFFQFAGKRGALLKKGIILSLVNSVFQAFQILAMAVVLEALTKDRVTVQTALISFGIMFISMIGAILTRQKATMAQAEGSFLMCADKRSAIGDRMKYMPMGYFNDNSLGSLTSAVTTTLEDVQDIAPRVMDKIIHGFVHAGVITLMLLVFDWRIGLIILGGILVFLGSNSLMQRKSRKISPQRVAAQTSLVGAVLEYVQGISVVRAFNLGESAAHTLEKAIAECEKNNVRLEMAFIPFMFLQSLILKFVSVLIAVASIGFYLSGTMPLMTCLLMQISVFLIYSQLETAGSMSALLRSVDVAIDRVEDIGNTPVMDEKGKSIKLSDYTIEGRNVSFSYDKRKILKEVSFTIPAGTTTAIVGPSGGGKSTLCSLITRFWDVEEGSITLGGKDIREYTLDSLLSNFSMVFQKVYLFNDTIINNIKFGKLAATEEEVVEAAKKARCHDFIAALPDGYNTLAGEGGTNLSGGERQRISIARAILKNAPIVILDEATANVDPENENRLQEAIAEMTKNKTIIMIAHRLKTVQNADQILVLEDGRITGRGNHKQLMEQGGLYADFVGMREEAMGWKLGKTLKIEKGYANDRVDITLSM